MESYAWKYWIKHYKNRITGIKENNFNFFKKLKVIRKKISPCTQNPHLFFSSWKQSHASCLPLHASGAIRGEEHPLPTRPAALAAEFIEMALLLLKILFSGKQAITPFSPPLQASLPRAASLLPPKTSGLGNQTQTRTVCKVKATDTVWESGGWSLDTGRELLAGLTATGPEAP